MLNQDVLESEKAAEMANPYQNIAVSNDGFSVSKQLTRCFEQSGFTILPDKTDVSSVFEADVTTRVLFLYTPAQDRIAAALSQGDDPTEACVMWKQSVEAILTLKRQYRNNFEVVDAKRALRSPAELIEVLCLEDHLKVNEGAPKDCEPVYEMMAYALIQADRVTQLFIGELEASKINPGSASMQEFSCIEQWIQAAQKSFSQHEKMFEEERAAGQGSLLQLAQQKAEIEKLKTRYLEIEASYMSARTSEAQVKLEEERFSRVSRERDALRRERDRLLKAAQSQPPSGQEINADNARTLHIQSLTRELAETTQILRQKNNRIDELVAEQQRILASKSFRLTAPLRRLRALVRGG